MIIRHALRLSTVAVVLAGGTSLMAQVTTGALDGHVTDSNGKPLAGARVTIESSALFQPRVIVTNAKGEYRALLLPVGNYTIKVIAQNFVGKTNKDVRVGVGSNLSLDFALKATVEAAATVQVVAEMAQTSKADDKVSANFSAEQLEQLPTDRSFSGALILAPGITGSGTDAQVRGSGANQINYRIDGIDVKDDSGNSQSLYQPLQDSIEDVQVVLSALNARNGRSQGGQVNVVTKSGSNTFEGTIRSYQSRLSWTADKPYAGDSIKNSSAGEDLSHYTDITVSGPIWKDRIWFYAGTRLQPNTTANAHFIGYTPNLTVGGVAQTLDQIITTPENTWGAFPLVDSELLHPTPQSAAAPNGLPAGYTLHNSFQDYGAPTTADTKFHKYEGKLTGMITENNILTFTYLNQKSTQGGTGTEGLDGAFTLEKSMIGDTEDKVSAYSLSLNSNIASNWTLEARFFKATHDSGQFFHADPGFTGGSVYGYFSTGDKNVKYTRNDSWSWIGPISFWGPFATGVNASAPDPTREGNKGITINVKTFQDLGGRHEIDFGGEQFATINNLGRARQGNMGIWTGGYFTDPSKAGVDRYLFPVFHADGNHGRLIPGSSLDDMSSQIQWNDQTLRGPSATIEKFWVRSTDTKNKSNALWVNDIYTIDAHWNIMVGLRYNSFSTDDTNGAKLNTLSLVEPRVQAKWNPDGNGKNVLSLSYAKLASAFSDQIAAGYRGSEWEVRTVHHWTGAGLANNGLAVDSPAGMNPANDPTHQVRYVNYTALNDMANYGPAVEYVDSRQFYKSKDLRVPFTNEIDLGFDHAFDNGWVRVNLVQRTYKDNVVQRVREYGLAGMTLMSDPSKGGSTGVPGNPIYQQNENWINSDNDQTYRGIELSWLRKVTDRMTFGGSFSQYRKTGTNDVDYYNYQSLRTAAGGPGDAAVGKGVLDKGLVARVHLTYVVPVGRGNVSASVMGAYWTAGNTTIYGLNSYNPTPWYKTDPATKRTYYDVDATHSYDVTALNTRGDGGDGLNGVAQSPLQYKTYFGPLGNWKVGSDQYQVNLKLMASIPLGLGKTVLLAEVQVNDIFNHVLPTGNGAFYDWNQDFDKKAIIGTHGDGAPLANFSTPWGKTADYQAYSQGRNLTNFSIGLKF